MTVQLCLGAHRLVSITERTSRFERENTGSIPVRGTKAYWRNGSAFRLHRKRGGPIPSWAT